jgi:hypothetical protein
VNVEVDAMSTDLGVWVYAITAASSAREEWHELRGLGGVPIHLISGSGLVAVASTVPLDEFGEGPMRRNLENLDWLATTARAHDAVVCMVARSGGTVPTRLATVYLNDDRVQTVLDKHAEELHALVQRVTHRTEWGVKAYRGSQEPKEPEENDIVAADEQGATRPGAGREYLQRRRAQLVARRSDDEHTERTVRDVHAALSALAADSRRRRPQDPRLTGRRERMVLNGSYLVDNARSAEFAQAVAALGEKTHGLRLELSGPWPPYSFASFEEIGK